MLCTGTRVRSDSTTDRRSLRGPSARNSFVCRRCASLPHVGGAECAPVCRTCPAARRSARFTRLGRRRRAARGSVSCASPARGIGASRVAVSRCSAFRAGGAGRTSACRTCRRLARTRFKGPGRMGRPYRWRHGSHQQQHFASREYDPIVWCSLGSSCENMVAEVSGLLAGHGPPVRG